MDIKYKTLTDFLKCPVLYKFKHKNNIKSSKINGKRYMKNMLKETACYFYEVIDKEKKVPKEVEIKNYWAEKYANIKDDLYFSRSREQKRIEDISHEFLKKFYVKYGRNPGTPIGVNMTYDINIGKHTIKDANIHLIRKIDDKKEIVFFDAGRYAPDNFRERNDIRFTLMALTYRTIFKEKEDRFLYTNIRKNKQLEIKRTQKDIDKAINQLDNIGEVIEQQLYWQRISYMCKSCCCSDVCTEWRGE